MFDQRFIVAVFRNEIQQKGPDFRIGAAIVESGMSFILL